MRGGHRRLPVSPAVLPGDGGRAGYPVYGQTERIFGLTPATDTQMGRVLFRVIDTISLGVAGVNAFMHWGDPACFPDPVAREVAQVREVSASPQPGLPTTTQAPRSGSSR